ncbi:MULTISPECIES: helix-turn-helix domain-containing protein [Pseudomonas]|uniref:helix-turn-helix domain-containing protein n=1 Tax=Pseudomonas TaxID=286 RepID=UPI001130F4D6|nr:MULTISPECIES: helix-turn-helix transcriptional regulator [Pseudomonas]MCU7215129.1 helix-turn-helix domain-containing protein [Pseudomonas sp. VE 196-7]TMU71367.1 helix-turn-helix transcriptional regulator [Pseudomonas fluorescens]
MELGQKLKEIRLTERLTQSEICEVTGIKLGTWKGYEYGARKEVSSGELLKITTHPRFMKYALWLVTDQTAPDCGQISPVIGQ